MKNDYTQALNGFLVSELPVDADLGRHWLINRDDKKYAIFAFQCDKRDFKNRYPHLIRRKINQMTALRLLEDEGEDLVAIGKLGKSTADDIFDWPS